MKITFVVSVKSIELKEPLIFKIYGLGKDFNEAFGNVYNNLKTQYPLVEEITVFNIII